MRKLGISIALLALAGCASTNYSDFDVSEAVISKLKINETHNLNERQHKLEISFDYEISEYVDTNNLYNCSVQFLALDGTTISMSNGKKSPCELNKAKGKKSIVWPTILDKAHSPSEEQLSKIKYPIEYFIAIHQRTGKNTNRIIGKSAIQVSTVKI